MEVIARDLRTLPPAVTGATRRLRRIDIATRDAMAAVKEKEEKLFEELAKAEKDRKENNSIVDEEYFTTKMQEITAERNAVMVQLEEKLQYSKAIYDFIDLKIQYIDEHTSGVRHLMQEDGDNNGPLSDKMMKKKKKRKQTDDYVAVNSLMYKADPNEPVYCYCRQVSYGEMVGCDNAECSIEWFHFECVGLTASPETKWYCPDCRPLFQK